MLALFADNENRAISQSHSLNDDCIQPISFINTNESLWRANTLYYTHTYKQNNTKQKQKSHLLVGLRKGNKIQVFMYIHRKKPPIRMGESIVQQQIGRGRSLIDVADFREK